MLAIRGSHRTFAEGGSQISQSFLNHPCHRVRAAQHASHGPFRVLERRHGLAEIVERGADISVARARALKLSAGREDAVDASLPAMRGLFPSQSIEGIFTQAWRADTNDTISNGGARTMVRPSRPRTARAASLPRVARVADAEVVEDDDVAVLVLMRARELVHERAHVLDVDDGRTGLGLDDLGSDLGPHEVQ